MKTYDQNLLIHTEEKHRVFRPNRSKNKKNSSDKQTSLSRSSRRLTDSKLEHQRVLKKLRKKNNSPEKEHVDTIEENAQAVIKEEDSSRYTTAKGKFVERPALKKSPSKSPKSYKAFSFTPIKPIRPIGRLGRQVTQADATEAKEYFINLDLKPLLAPYGSLSTKKAPAKPQILLPSANVDNRSVIDHLRFWKDKASRDSPMRRCDKIIRSINRQDSSDLSLIEAQISDIRSRSKAIAVNEGIWMAKSVKFL